MQPNHYNHFNPLIAAGYSMPTSNHWQQLCNRLQLGNLLEQPRAIPGGLLHAVFKLTTTTGSFAAKIFNSNLPQALTAELAAATLAEEIALQMAEKGIPAICALTAFQEILIGAGKRRVLVYPWIEGKILSSSQLQPKQAQIIGKLLAKMQQVEISLAGLAAFNWPNFTKEHWLILHKQAVQQQPYWLTEFSNALPKIIQWSQLAATAMPLLEPELCVAHRDLRLKNIIWQDTETPAVIDWEYAGLIPPDLDLMIVALNCSATERGINKEIFLALKTGYLQEKQILPKITANTVWAYFGYCLEWLEFCLKRALQQPEDYLAVQEICNTLQILLNVENYREILLIWFNTDQ